MDRPRLRQTAGDPPPFQLNHFPSHFPYSLGKRLIYFLCVNQPPKIEGSQWEQMFADAIGASWVNSNAELDDVRLQNCAWSGKAVYGAPAKQKVVRLISGRNNIQYSFGRKVGPTDDPNEVGKLVLEIWNARVAGVRKFHQHLRTVVLIKSADLSQYSVFEKETLLELPEEFEWHWNKNDNLVGVSRHSGVHRFTWQVNGQQFTIHESVPENRLVFSIRVPKPLDVVTVLEGLGYTDEWVDVLDPFAP